MAIQRLLDVSKPFLVLYAMKELFRPSSRRRLGVEHLQLLFPTQKHNRKRNRGKRTPFIHQHQDRVDTKAWPVNEWRLHSCRPHILSSLRQLGRLIFGGFCFKETKTNWSGEVRIQRLVDVSRPSLSCALCYSRTFPVFESSIAWGWTRAGFFPGKETPKQWQKLQDSKMVRFHPSLVHKACKLKIGGCWNCTLS